MNDPVESRDAVRASTSVVPVSGAGVGEATVLPLQREVLISWRAPQRYFSPMDKKKFWFVLACVLAFFVVLFLVGQYFLMVAIAAVMFLLYVLGTVPPVEVTHTLTTVGIETVGGPYAWGSLKGYWFCRRDNQILLNVDTNLRFPGRILMLVRDKDVKAVNAVMQKKLVYEEFKTQSKLRKVIDGEWVDMATL